MTTISDIWRDYLALREHHAAIEQHMITERRQALCGVIKLLPALRERLNWSTRDMAKHLGVPEWCVCAIERGEASPAPDIVARLAMLEHDLDAGNVQAKRHQRTKKEH